MSFIAPIHDIAVSSEHMFRNKIVWGHFYLLESFLHVVCYHLICTLSISTTRTVSELNRRISPCYILEFMNMVKTLTIFIYVEFTGQLDTSPI